MGLIKLTERGEVSRWPKTLLGKMDLDRSTTLRKFDPIGVQTYDL